MGRARGAPRAWACDEDRLFTDLFRARAALTGRPVRIDNLVLRRHALGEREMEGAGEGGAGHGRQ